MRHVALWTVAVLALAAAPGALADGYAGYALQTGTGVVSANGKVRYVAVAAGQTATASTTVESISTADGSILRSLSVIGSFGTPFIAQPQDGLGLSADGRTLVLADVPTSFPHTRSAFSFLSTHPLEYQTGVSLKGDFAFDALSPDGRRLYLIQHVDPGDPTQLRYVVRALDVPTLRLLPGRIADRTQKSWIMRGSAVTRTTSPGGRWVYTLYDNPGRLPVRARARHRPRRRPLRRPAVDRGGGGRLQHAALAPRRRPDARSRVRERAPMDDHRHPDLAHIAGRRRHGVVGSRSRRGRRDAPPRRRGGTAFSAAAVRGCASATSSPGCSARRASRSRSPSAPPASLRARTTFAPSRRRGRG